VRPILRLSDAKSALFKLIILGIHITGSFVIRPALKIKKMKKREKNSNFVEK
jgi:hypothetical protein